MRGTPLNCPAPGTNAGTGGATSAGGGTASGGRGGGVTSAGGAGGGAGGATRGSGGVKFGAGDVIGCGIAYVTNNRLDPRLFFTKNGVLVGVKYHQRLRLAVAEPLFPCVGSVLYPHSCTYYYPPAPMPTIHSQTHHTLVT